MHHSNMIAKAFSYSLSIMFKPLSSRHHTFSVFLATKHAQYDSYWMVKLNNHALQAKYDNRIMLSDTSCIHAITSVVHNDHNRKKRKNIRLLHSSNYWAFPFAFLFQVAVRILFVLGKVHLLSISFECISCLRFSQFHPDKLNEYN